MVGAVEVIGCEKGKKGMKNGVEKKEKRWKKDGKMKENGVKMLKLV